MGAFCKRVRGHALYSNTGTRDSDEPDVDPATITLDFLYRRYAPMLRNFCRGRLGDFEQDADDACHETVLKAYRALPHFRRGPLWPWLATIAAHVCIDIIRQHSRLVEIDGQQDRAAPAELGDEEAEATRERIVQTAMESLPARYRDLIRRHHIQGWSCDELAAAQGLHAPAIASALARARRSLRKAIEKTARTEGQWPLPGF